MINIASELKSARMKKQIPLNDAANICGLSPSEYMDLEAYDDEFITVISLDAALKICGILDINFFSLMNTNNLNKSNQFNSIDAFSKYISQYTKANHWTHDELEEHVGWEFSNIICDTRKMRENPLKFFIDLGNTLCVDWFDIVKLYI